MQDGTDGEVGLWSHCRKGSMNPVDMNPFKDVLS